MAKSVEPLVPKKGCPICGKPRDPKYDPFCSKRCAEIDLSRWLKGVYAIPGAESDEDGTPPATNDDNARET